jgi:hypothetical protein
MGNYLDFVRKVEDLAEICNFVFVKVSNLGFFLYS